MEKNFKSVVLNILTSGTVSYSRSRQRRIIFLNLLTALGVIILYGFGVKELSDGNYLTAAMELTAGSCSLFSIIIMRWKKWILPSCYFTNTVIFLLFVYFLFLGNTHNIQSIWIMIFPFMTTFMLGTMVGTIYSSALFTAMLALFFIPGIKLTGYDSTTVIRMIGFYILCYSVAAFTETLRSSIQGQLEESQENLTRAKNQTDRILENVKEGLFLLDNDMKIGDQYSRYLSEILHLEEPAGMPFPDYLETKLTGRDKEACKDYFDLYRDPKISNELLEEMNPLNKVELNFSNSKGEFSTRYLDFQFKRLGTESRYRILGTVQDITEEVLLERRLEKQRKQNQRDMELLFQIIKIQPDMLKTFTEDAGEELENLFSLLKEEQMDNNEKVQQAYQSIHAIKSNALLLGLTDTGEELHSYEDKLKDIMERTASWNDMLELSLMVGDIRDTLKHINKLIEEVSRFQIARTGEPDCMLTNLIRQVLKNSPESRDKQILLETHNFNSAHIPREYFKLVKEVMIQLTRNSLYHGLEEPEERKALGKNEQGTISLKSVKEKDTLVLTFRDDGRGLDLERIRAKAGDKSRDLPAKELIKFIFQPGFSTATEANTTAGRGIGMDLVKSRIEKHGGKLKMKSRKGHFLEWHIHLPLTGAA